MALKIDREQSQNPEKCTRLGITYGGFEHYPLICVNILSPKGIVRVPLFVLPRHI